jgi:methyl-accepting chemotaxis protein
MKRMVTILLLVALGPLAIVGVLSFLSGQDALQEQSLGMLSSIRDIQRGAVADYLHNAVATATFLASYNRVQMGLEYLRPLRGSERESSILYKRLSEFLGMFVQLYSGDGYHDALLIRPDGLVVFTVKELADFGSNLKTGDLKDSVLTNVWEKVVESQKSVTSDFTIYSVSGAPALFVGVPVFTGKDKKFCGVFALRIGPERINAIMKLPGSAGKTAKTYLVGRDGLMRSQSKFVDESTVMKRRVNSASVKMALEGKSGIQIAPDYRGVPVLTSFCRVGIDRQKELGADFDWAVLAEIDRREANQPAGTLARKILAIAAAVALVVVIVAFSLARGITGPITALAGIAGRVSKGDLTVQVADTKGADEIAALVGSFRLMVKNLKGQIGWMLEGVSILSSEASEISTTAAELAANTAETHSALTETTTTVEQVKQAAKLASEKAKNLAEMAQKAMKVSTEGKRATETTVERINQIKGQMESIGETVVKLDEHSRAIEDIIATVQDLAQQSNLLAVNASIEAARAGDQGKGFAVVASEIKTLADQSKEAIEQVSTIIENTRRWVNAVVMATEQGMKAVETGVKQSAVAGESISALSKSVELSSQAASVIEAASDQQSGGVDQVASAMTSIEQAARHSLAGSTQLEDSAKKLADLAVELKKVVEEYKT